MYGVLACGVWCIVMLRVFRDLLKRPLCGCYGYKAERVGEEKGCCSALRQIGPFYYVHITCINRPVT